MNRLFKYLFISMTVLGLMAQSTYTTCQAESLDSKDRNTLIQADIDSQRIPAGKKINIKIQTPLNSYIMIEGDYFLATISDDIFVDNKLILPAGTAIRGTVLEIKKSKMLMRGAQVLLDFDHVVTPVGKQIPLTAVITDYENLTLDGALTTANSGYLRAVGSYFNDGIDTVKSMTSNSYEFGKQYAGGFPAVITAPAGAIAGSMVGAGGFAGRSAIGIFKKGEDVDIQKGQSIQVTLMQPLDIPSN